MRLMVLYLGVIFFGHSGFAQNTLLSPSVSANALFLYRNSNFGMNRSATERNGLDIQEAELAFFADVDPYSRLSILLAIHPEYEEDTANNKVEQSWAVEPEELFAESNHIPGITVKLGKFKAAFGKHNMLHSHVFPFVDAPLANSQLLGNEGLNDIGLSASALVPVSWYSEVTAQYLRGEGENAAFGSPSPSDGVGVGRWKNLWDLSDELTFELGGSYAWGHNTLDGDTRLWGADITFRWRPVEGGKYHSWLLGSELIDRNFTQPTATEDENGTGWNVWGQYQFAERWSALGRYEELKVSGANATLNPDALANGTIKKISAGIQFVATEFSSFRLEYNHADGVVGPKGQGIEKKIYLQANFTIGAHPTHAY